MVRDTVGHHVVKEIDALCLEDLVWQRACAVLGVSLLPDDELELIFNSREGGNLSPAPESSHALC